MGNARTRSTSIGLEDVITVDWHPLFRSSLNTAEANSSPIRVSAGSREESSRVHTGSERVYISHSFAQPAGVNGGAGHAN